MSRTVLDMARAGDERAFGELVGPHRRELRAHCYRMLGSFADAEDLLQETLTAAWRGLAGFEGRSSLRTWLYRIATNRCLNAIRDRRRAPAEPVPPFTPPEPTARGEVTWLQPFPDALLDGEPGPAARYELRESVELAFVAAVQRLPPRQAAMLLLCDVLGFSLAEAAGMIDATPVSAKGLLQRARAGVGPPRETRVAAAEERELARRFAAAYSADDVDGVVALLTDDAWLSMPPAPHEYRGRAAIAGFLRASTGWRVPVRFELVATQANGAPAFGCFLAGKPAGLIVLGTAAGGIDRVTHFLDMDLPTAVFGLSP